MSQQRTLPGTTTRTTTRTRPIGWVGRLIGALVNTVLLVAVHVWPGWAVVPFLTTETPKVLGAIDAVLVAGIGVHLLLMFRGPSWRTPVGNLVTSVVGGVATLRLLQVFPFSFDGGVDWAPIVRVLLVLGIVGCVIGALVSVVQLVRLRLVTRG